jgi:hypothetical protein
MLYAGFIYFKLQTAVEAVDLRHHYRRACFNVVRRRPEPFALQAYALKALLHYHYHKLIATIDADGHLLNISCRRCHVWMAPADQGLFCCGAMIVGAVMSSAC